LVEKDEELVFLTLFVVGVETWDLSSKLSSTMRLELGSVVVEVRVGWSDVVALDVVMAAVVVVEFLSERTGVVRKRFIIVVLSMARKDVLSCLNLKLNGWSHCAGALTMAVFVVELTVVVLIRVVDGGAKVVVVGLRIRIMALLLLSKYFHSIWSMFRVSSLENA
jgi:hypothetical protein